MRALLVAAAIACGILAVFGPLERLADRSFAWHMAQHLVMLILVPLLVLWSQPFSFVRRLLGDARTVRLLRATRPLHVIAFPPVAQFLERWRSLLRRRARADFDQEVAGLTRVEIAVAFLALLELRKQNELVLSQSAPFAPIRISRPEAERSLAWNVRSA